MKVWSVLTNKFLTQLYPLNRMDRKIEIATLNISVKVLMLDNKRFTKSVYKQLPHYVFPQSYEKYLVESETRQILGYVKDDSHAEYSMLINDNGVLQRWEYPSFYKEQLYREFEKSVSKYSQIFISC